MPHLRSLRTRVLTLGIVLAGVGGIAAAALGAPSHPSAVSRGYSYSTGSCGLPAFPTAYESFPPRPGSEVRWSGYRPGDTVFVGHGSAHLTLTAGVDGTVHYREQEAFAVQRGARRYEFFAAARGGAQPCWVQATYWRT